MSLKCTIHIIDDISKHLKNKNLHHGDIVIKTYDTYNNICLIFKQHHIKLINVLDLNKQSINYINVPTIISKYIKDPLEFYSMLTDLRYSPTICSISEIYLCEDAHIDIIKKYFKHYKNKHRFTIAFPMIYKISINNSYNLTARTIVPYNKRSRERTLT